MNKLITKIAACAFLVLATGICNSEDSTPSTGSTSSGQASPPRGEQAGGQTTDVGRGDPFGGSFGDAASEPQTTTIIGDLLGAKPQLFVHAVTLKYLNATKLKEALDKMSTKDYGGISVDDTTNTLIICDTKEKLEQMLGDPDKGLEVKPELLRELKASLAATRRGKRGIPLEQLAKEMGLDLA